MGERREREVGEGRGGREVGGKGGGRRGKGGRWEEREGMKRGRGKRKEMTNV